MPQSQGAHAAVRWAAAITGRVRAVRVVCATGSGVRVLLFLIYFFLECGRPCGCWREHCCCGCDPLAYHARMCQLAFDLPVRARGEATGPGDWHTPARAADRCQADTAGRPPPTTHATPSRLLARIRTRAYAHTRTRATPPPSLPSHATRSSKHAPHTPPSPSPSPPPCSHRRSRHRMPRVRTPLPPSRRVSRPDVCAAIPACEPPRLVCRHDASRCPTRAPPHVVSLSYGFGGGFATPNNPTRV